MSQILRVTAVLRSGWVLGTVMVLGCLLLGADLSQGAQTDICGCANNPNTLGDFDDANPATYPPGTVNVPNNPIGGASNITIPLPADGVLVFKSFTASSLPQPCCSGTFIFFKRNAANSPVTILVSGDVRIDAGVELRVAGDDAIGGTNGINGLGGLGGPGGSRGGDGAYQMVNLAADGGAGFGPGGGAAGTGAPTASNGGNATFIGVPELMPLVGGSGGGGGGSSSNAPNCSAGGGGGGGGALLFAVNGTVTLNGTLLADGGTAGDPANSNCSTEGGTGSGGAIRVVANQITGGGQILARPGRRCAGCGDGDRPGSPGIIRLEAFTDTLAGNLTTPPASRALAPGPIVAPITPTLAITQINGQPVPVSPQGFLGVTDLVLSAPGVVPVNVRTSAVPGGTTVQVTVKPRVGGAPVSQSPTLSTCDGTGVCTASTSFNLPAGEFVVEAQATFKTP